MPLYNYECCDCQDKLHKKLLEHKRQPTIDEYESLVLFETKHKMRPTAEELAAACICPRCNSTNCVKTMYGSNVIGYVRGNGYLDVVGAKRDMNIHTLTYDDPYAHMRQDGEVDDMKHKIKRAGRHDPKRIHSIPPTDASMNEAVAKAVFSKQ